MMELAKHLVDFFLHIDVHLSGVIAQYGVWTYAILFLVIFAETGSLGRDRRSCRATRSLFAAGALCAGTVLSVHALAVLLAVAAVIGNLINYGIGAYLGPKVFSREDSWLLRRKHLDHAHAFFDRYGGRSVILSRFMPIIRTFVPFVAGVGRMPFGRFFAFNLAGGVTWVFGLTYLGYFFGRTEIVKKNFGLVVIAIIAISLLPMAVELLRAWRNSRRAPAA